MLMGLPLGVMPLCAIVLAWLALAENRQIKRNFGTLWLHFTIYSGVVGMMMYLLLSLYQWRVMPLQPILIGWLLTVFCYPPIHALMLKILRHFKWEEHA